MKHQIVSIIIGALVAAASVVASSPTISAAAAWPLVGFILLTAMLVGVLGFSRINLRKLPMLPTVIMIISFVGFVAGGVWFYMDSSRAEQKPLVPIQEAPVGQSAAGNEAKASGSGTATSGNVTATNGGVAIGHGAHVTIGPSPEQSELQRRSKILTQILGDYMSSHDNIPPLLRDLLDKATPFVNAELERRQETWRLDAQTRGELDLPI